MELGWIITGGILALTALVLWQLVRRLNQLRRENAELRTANDTLTDFVDADDLTDAKSRRFLADRLDRRTRENTHGLLFVDLDDFKSVNDGYGHEVGDALLKAIASAMVDRCRGGDFVARMGGDEFCVFLEDCDLEQATKAADRFGHAVANTFILAGDTRVRRTASVGVTSLDPDQSLLDALIVADAATYAAKRKGSNCVVAADEEVWDHLMQRQSRPTTEDLADALDADEITYFVQPIFDLAAQKAVGVEALIRWVKPDGNVLGPDMFLDLMTANYSRNLRPPLVAANKLATTFTTMDPPLFCAWNISSSFLGRNLPDDPQWIYDLLNGVDPNRTVFEIVESAVIENPENTRRLLHMLRDTGIRVALDDFGTGLSNLERLVEYPVDIVKIDRSFVSRIGQGANTAILQGLVAMRDSMGFEIIAEGIETVEQMDRVQALGITKAQGFLLGKPGSVAHWEKELRTSPKS